MNNFLKNLFIFDFVEEGVRFGELEIFGMYYDFYDGKFISWKVIFFKVVVFVSVSL